MIETYSPTILVVSVVALAAFASWFLYTEHVAELAFFRANIRPGDLCLVKSLNGRYFRAKIVLRDSENLFTVQDIDTKQSYSTVVSQIFPA